VLKKRPKQPIEMNRISLLLISLITCCTVSQAQDTVHYSGTTLSNVDYHDGRLTPAVGVHNIQIFRANREHPELAEGFGFTYNLCYATGITPFM
jgi:hypothetical protein